MHRWAFENFFVHLRVHNYVRAVRRHNPHIRVSGVRMRISQYACVQADTHVCVYDARKGCLRLGDLFEILQVERV